MAEVPEGEEREVWLVWSDNTLSQTACPVTVDPMGKVHVPVHFLGRGRKKVKGVKFEKEGAPHTVEQIEPRYTGERVTSMVCTLVGRGAA